MLDRLPEGVIEEILSFALRNYNDDDDAGDWNNYHSKRRWLRSLCLLCRSWASTAQRSLLMDVELEYSSTRQTVQRFSKMVSSSSSGDVNGARHLSRLVRRLKISTAVGAETRKIREHNSQDLARHLQVIMAHCTNLLEIHYTPDDDAFTHERLYVQAWKLGHFQSFTIVISKFRELALLPYGHHHQHHHHGGQIRALRMLTITLASGGDLEWDYDFFFPLSALAASTTGDIGDSRYLTDDNQDGCKHAVDGDNGLDDGNEAADGLARAREKQQLQHTVRADEIVLRNLSFPSYSEQVMLGKLTRLCENLQPPPRVLSFQDCTMSSAVVNYLVGGWAGQSLEELRILGRLCILDGNDAVQAYHELPLLPAQVLEIVYEQEGEPQSSSKKKKMETRVCLAAPFEP